jgi:hypothetical protein
VLLLWPLWLLLFLVSLLIAHGQTTHFHSGSISNINNELERGQKSNRHGFKSSVTVQSQCRRIVKDEHEVIVERGGQAEAYIQKEREGNK